LIWFLYLSFSRSHADESGRPVPTHPLFFLKPSTSYVVSPNPIRLPLETLVEYELELGVVIGKKGKNIKKERAFEYIDGAKQMFYFLHKTLTDDC
jgi:acylpyruvate hydrolase